MIRNKLGLFVRVPVPGSVKTRLVPPLSPEAASKLYLAFLQDFTARLQQSRLRPTVFIAGGGAGDLGGWLPGGWPVVEQRGETLGERLASAFEHLLEPAGTRAVVIGSDSPDLPLVHIKRAFRLLKHRDAVLGPALDGGYYLIGLRRPVPSLFEGVAWGTDAVFNQTVGAAEKAGLSISLTPPWYDVDDAASLALLRSLCTARRLAGGERLPNTEHALETDGA